MLLAGFGTKEQDKLRSARVLIVGAGGLGSPVALYLVAAGVGTIGLVDYDTVDVSNLQRQILHTTRDIDRPKVASAEEKLRAINPHVSVEVWATALDQNNAENIVGRYDFVVEATDNLEAKFLVNDVCVRMGKAYSHGGIADYGGEAMTHVAGTACLRCVYGAPPPDDTKKKIGVLGSVAGLIGSVQATETIKYFTGIGQLLTDKLLVVDAADMTFAKMNVGRNPQCPVCKQ